MILAGSPRQEHSHDWTCPIKIERTTDGCQEASRFGLWQQRKQVSHSCSELYSLRLLQRSDMQAVLPSRIAQQLVANSPRLRTVRLGGRPSIQRSILAVHSTEQSLFTTTRRGGSSSNAWHRPVTDLPQRMWQVRAAAPHIAPSSDLLEGFKGGLCILGDIVYCRGTLPT